MINKTIGLGLLVVFRTGYGLLNVQLTVIETA